MFELAPFIKFMGNGIGGAGTSKHVAGIARLAIIVLAFNSQQISAAQTKIRLDIADLRTHIDTNDRRITNLENLIMVAYNGSIPLTSKKRH